MQDIWKFLASKKLAVYMLVVLVVVLFVSTLFPSDITLSAPQWYDLEQRSPFKFWLASHFSTPYLTSNPLFILLNLFLFLSTLVCTISRLRSWARLRKTEFEKTKAFTFQRKTTSVESRAAVDRMVTEILGRGKWDVQKENEVIAAQKGLGLGFWGSVVFHLGLLVCFLATPVTAFSVLRGQMILTGDVPINFREAVAYTSGEDMPVSKLPNVEVRVHELRGVYAEGQYKLDFSGRIDIGGWDVPFSVNKPVDYHGLQISLHEYGHAPKVTIEKDHQLSFDYFLNLRNPDAGDYFTGPDEGLELFVLFFPDFVREGDMLGSKSEEPNNPVLLFKFIKDGKPLHKGLLMKPGEEQKFEDYTVKFGELRNWVSFIVVREWGILVIAVGFLIGIPGLFVRFLSNERRLEFALSGRPTGETEISIKGYSRYYPAFLEREVNKMAETLSPGEGE